MSAPEPVCPDCGDIMEQTCPTTIRFVTAQRAVLRDYECTICGSCVRAFEWEDDYKRGVRLRSLIGNWTEAAKKSGVLTDAGVAMMSNVGSHQASDFEREPPDCTQCRHFTYWKCEQYCQAQWTVIQDIDIAANCDEFEPLTRI